MEKVVEVRGVRFGEGAPKICVPLVSETKQRLLEDARALEGCTMDLVEWRMDCFEAFADTAALLDALKDLSAILGDTPLLCTFRTKKEGGNAELAFEQYKELNMAVAQSGCADLIDIELFSAPAEELMPLIRHLHAYECKVVVSTHDFQKTPPVEELVRRLKAARTLGGDLPKAAVMPNSKADVLALLSATEQVSREDPGPIITMSMGAMGGISRLCGEVFGSCLTFGCVGRASAPGQFEAPALHCVLDIIHKSL